MAEALGIRPARAGDREAIVDLHLASWQETYRGLMPDAYLDGELPGVFANRWQARFDAPQSDDVVLVAELGGVVRGFFYGCRDVDAPERFFMENMHVSAALRGSGTGTALMRRAARAALALGFRSAVLYIIDGNEGAGRLYTRLGWIRGIPVRREVEGLGQVDEVPFTFDDLSRLAV